MTWVIVANSNDCRIFDYQKSNKEIVLIKELNNPYALKKSSEMGEDAPGSFKARDAAHGSYSFRITPKEDEIEKFAHQVAMTMNEGRRKEMFDDLLLIAGPHINGMIHGSLDSHLQNSAKRIEKDYTKLSEIDLLKKLKSFFKPKFGL